MPQVVLFKTQSVVNGKDAYQESFAQAGFETQYIPVLQEAFHIDELTQLITDKNANWGGVVITSKRGAEGWIQAAQRCSEDSDLANWNDIQLYTVGSTSLDTLSESNLRLPECLRLDTARSIQAKSATALLPLLLQTPNIQDRPLLLIRGDKSTNELQHGLNEGERTYFETIVYVTTRRPSLQDDIKALVQRIKEGKSEIWLAFFSPSSAQMVLDEFPPVQERCENDIWSKTKSAAIGETTAHFLVEYGVEVHAAAKEPTPKGIVDAIQAFEQAMDRDGTEE